jgi:IS1 family transposase
MTGVAKKTVMRLLGDVGFACREYQDKTLVNLNCKNIQCDEIWSFCGMKEKNVAEENQGKYGYGDVYTFVALCADCKLVANFLVGRRDIPSTTYFIRGLEKRIPNRVQITTDGFGPYRDAVLNHFGRKADFAQLVKSYSASGRDSAGEVRYSPPDVVSSRKVVVIGNPNPARISTSLIERQNLTMRMQMRRFTRLTNAFSKKIENLRAAVALHFMYYNFVRTHQTLGVTPAMKAGITPKKWEIEDILGLLNSK